MTKYKFPDESGVCDSVLQLNENGIFKWVKSSIYTLEQLDKLIEFNDNEVIKNLAIQLRGYLSQDSETIILKPSSR